MDMIVIDGHLRSLCEAMMVKGIVQPEVCYQQTSGGLYSLHLSAPTTPKVLLGADYSEVYTAACAYIAAMPDPETLVMRTYLGKLADAVDYGHSNGIAAEYVDPVRITQKTMSENLIGVAK